MKSSLILHDRRWGQLRLQLELRLRLKLLLLLLLLLFLLLLLLLKQQGLLLLKLLLLLLLKLLLLLLLKLLLLLLKLLLSYNSSFESTSAHLGLRGDAAVLLSPVPAVISLCGGPLIVAGKELPCPVLEQLPRELAPRWLQHLMVNSWCSEILTCKTAAGECPGEPWVAPLREQGPRLHHLLLEKGRGPRLAPSPLNRNLERGHVVLLGRWLLGRVSACGGVRVVVHRVVAGVAGVAGVHVGRAADLRQTKPVLQVMSLDLLRFMTCAFKMGTKGQN